MIQRPVDGKEREKIMSGQTEGERIDTARLLAFVQGGIDERFSLKWFIEAKPWLVRCVLRLMFRQWFEQRDRESSGYGMNWNSCEI